MLPDIIKQKKIKTNNQLVILTKGIQNVPSNIFSDQESGYVRKMMREKKNEMVVVSQLENIKYYYEIRDNRNLRDSLLEKCRRVGENIASHSNKLKAVHLTVYDGGIKLDYLLAIVEGIALGNYQFIRHKSKPGDKESSLKQIFLVSDNVKEHQVEELKILCQAVYQCRDLVNEPWSGLNAGKLANEFLKLGEESGIKVEVLDKAEIEALGMGGLLAVNKGSVDPPTFTIMEWNPGNAINKKPIVFVGKGIVFDTGGLSLKPPASMEGMKGDMAGAAAVACALSAIAKMNLRVHVVALLPATDNRPNGNATVPGDVITIMNGTTVEVLNTDAEGRLILADALSYAKRLDPMLVIDLATLTGAAAAAIGSFAMVGMQTGAKRYFEKLSACGFRCNERIVEFPLWEEYGEMIKSDIADIKNIGGKQAGAITAGKFLERFTDYPWIHLDIAGPALIEGKDGYRAAGGTGVGVRLLTDFIKKMNG